MGVRTINNNQGGSIRVLRTTPGINQGGVWIGNYILNSYPGAIAGYSLRKLSAYYTGPVIRVRRDSDNTEQDIGFTFSYEGSKLDENALTAFVGNANGFVTRWYDQSGNGIDQVRTTANEQPQIVTNGTLYTSNGKLALYFNGNMSMRSPAVAQLTSPSGEWSSVGVVSTLAFDRTRVWFSSDGTGFAPAGNTRIGQFLRTNFGTAAWGNVAFNTSGTAFTDSGTSWNSNQNILLTNRTTSTVEIFSNNAQTNGPTTTSGTPTTLPGFISAGYREGITISLAQPLGYIQELIHYPLNSTSFYQNMMRSINSYYKTF